MVIVKPLLQQHQNLTQPDTTVQEALQFLDRLVLLCERNCLALQDFTGGQGQVTALDLGCAVGGSSFALARAFQSVVGVDSSDHFIKAAQVSNRVKQLGFCIGNFISWPAWPYHS